MIYCHVVGEQDNVLSQLNLASAVLFNAGMTINDTKISPIRSFEVGNRVSFKLRLRPVAPRGDPKTDIERQLALTDVFALADIGAGVQADQYTVYREWFSNQVATAAILLKFSILRTDEKTIWVRTGATEASPRKGPDILVEATVVVKDSKQFSSLVINGIGECTEWGFGFLRFVDETSDALANEIA